MCYTEKATGMHVRVGYGITARWSWCRSTAVTSGSGMEQLRCLFDSAEDHVDGARFVPQESGENSCEHAMARRAAPLQVTDAMSAASRHHR